MKIVRTALVMVVVLGSLGGTGCGGTDVRSQTVTTTTGQELLDLKKAFDAGVISEKEYKRKRDDILARD